MTRQEEQELFEFLSRQSKFRAWLTIQREKDVEVLAKSLEVDMLRRAQGSVGLIDRMTGLLDYKPPVDKK